MNPSDPNAIVLVAGNGSVNGDGFNGVALNRPVVIVLAGDQQSVTTIATKIRDELPHLGGNVQPAGQIDDPQAVLGDRDYLHLLVLASDGITPAAVPPFAASWADSIENNVLPVMPEKQRDRFATMFPQVLKKNAALWSNTPDDVLPAVLTASAITPPPRIFISYRQKESHGLAVQLFDALSHSGFDVFLDRHRVQPAADFQSILTEELGDKAMVVVLASETFLDSEWCVHEINVARECRLTVCSLQLPRGKRIDYIDASARLDVQDSDFAGGVFAPGALLDTDALSRVTAFLRRQHDLGVTSRRGSLRESIRAALTLAGVTVTVDTSGALLAKKASNADYVIWPSPRPPELLDFHQTYRLRSTPPKRGVVVGLSQLFARERAERMTWLSGISDIVLVDEGQFGAAADLIAQGKL